MTGLPVDLVVLDLTGTTVKDNGAMEASLKGALARHGVPFTQADITAMRGAGKAAAFQAMAERTLGESVGVERIASLGEALHGSFKEMLREAFASGSVEEVPGAGTAMRSLKEHGVKLAAATALSRDIMGLVLGRLGWNEGLFDALVGSDDVPRGRPAPYMSHVAMMRTGVVDVRRVAVVGDTPLDLRAGANAGAGWIVGVLSGVHGLKTLGTTAHTHLLRSVADLPAVFE